MIGKEKWKKKRGYFMGEKRTWKETVKKLGKCFLMLVISFLIGTTAFQTSVYAVDTQIGQEKQQEDVQSEQMPLQQEGEEDGTSFLMVFMILIVFLVIVVVIVVASSVSTLGAVMSKQLDD